MQSKIASEKIPLFPIQIWGAAGIYLQVFYILKTSEKITLSDSKHLLVNIEKG